MPMSAIESDLDVIFSTDDFGTSASIFITSTGATVTVNGIFDSADIEVDDGSFTQYVKETTFQCRSTDLSALAQDDTVTIGSVVYYVAFVVNDGQGTITIHLSTDTV